MGRPPIRKSGAMMDAERAKRYRRKVARALKARQSEHRRKAGTLRSARGRAWREDHGAAGSPLWRHLCRPGVAL
jgi:hypothetical protein